MSWTVIFTGVALIILCPAAALLITLRSRKSQAPGR